MANILYRQESFDIVGAAFAVHDALGPGFDEKKAIEIEFQARNIPYEREKRLNVSYKGIVLDKNNKSIHLKKY